MASETSTGTNARTEVRAIGHVVSPDGTSIGYERSGSGPPLVLVHGTSGDRTRWAPILPGLEAHFTVYAMDRRGRGLSGDAEEFALEREYEDMAAVIDSIEGPVDVLGHSYGALCALEGALRTSNVGRLVLYEPPANTGEQMYQDGARERLEELIAAGERERALTYFFSEVVGMSEQELAQMRAAPSWQARVEAAHTVPREFDDADYMADPARLAALAVPVLMLTGSESPRFLRRATEVIDDALPNSQVVVMEGEAHVANTTAPELFTRLVLDFLLD
jgi:pimeloyl-ACP methyl ester carboxylesterase